MRSTDARLSFSSGQENNYELWADAEEFALGALKG